MEKKKKKQQLEPDMEQWFKTGKGSCQGCMMSFCLFNIDAKNIMWNAKLDELEAGIKITGRNFKKNWYANDITLMPESKEEIESLLMRVKEKSEKAGLKLKNLRSWYLVPSLRGKEMGKNGNSDRNYFCGLQNHCEWWLKPWNQKMLAPWKKSCDKLRHHIKKQRHYFADKIHIIEALVFPVVMYRHVSWTIKMAECWIINAFELCC